MIILLRKFTYKNKNVILTLKPEYSDILKENIIKGVKLYGKGTEENWKYVRELALKYWEEWDRHEIFEISQIR